jgi:hypothetical protein
MLRAAEAYAAECRLPCLRLETRIELEENHRLFAQWGFVRTAEASHPGFTRPTFIEMRKVL